MMLAFWQMLAFYWLNTRCTFNEMGLSAIQSLISLSIFTIYSLIFLLPQLELTFQYLITQPTKNHTIILLCSQLALMLTIDLWEPSARASGLRFSPSGVKTDNQYQIQDA
jgi:hypothetical protein